METKKKNARINFESAYHIVLNDTDGLYYNPIDRTCYPLDSLVILLDTGEGPAKQFESNSPTTEGNQVHIVWNDKMCGMKMVDMEEACEDWLRDQEFESELNRAGYVFPDALYIMYQYGDSKLMVSLRESKTFKSLMCSSVGLSGSERRDGLKTFLDILRGNF